MPGSGASMTNRHASVQATATAFAALFSVVGLALYGLPLYYDFMVREFGWSRTMVTSGNALSKLVVGPLFGFGAGWIVDRFGPRRLMLAGIVMAGGALIGLGTMSAVWAFYLFYFFNAPGYVCGGAAGQSAGCRQVARRRRENPEVAGVLSAGDRQHVLDRRGRRRQSASEAVPQPRSRLHARRCGADHLARSRGQHRRPRDDGMARGSRGGEI